MIADVMSDGHTYYMKRPDFENYIRDNDFCFFKRKDLEIDDLVSKVNKMVKDESCPHNLQRRFYEWKHRYIKKLIKKDRIEKTIESEKLYHFFVRGGRNYHQPKNAFPNGVPNLSEEAEIYDSEKAIILSFDNNVYKECIVQLILFLYFGEIKATDNK
jgi:hypothetical protein